MRSNTFSAKLISAALAVTLTVGFVPMGAFAQDEAIEASVEETLAQPAADDELIAEATEEQPLEAELPEVEEPSAEDSEVESPLAEQPAGDQPAGDQFGAEQPASEQIATAQPGTEKPLAGQMVTAQALSVLGEKAEKPEKAEKAEKAEEAEELMPLAQDVWAEWPNFRGNSHNNGIVHFDMPASADEAQLMYSIKMGSGWSNAVSTQLIVDNCLVFMAGQKIYKADLYSGAIVAQGDLTVPFNWGYTPFAYGEGKIFVSLSSGHVQCFDATSLQSLWIYKDPLGGQSVSPVVYSDGYVYTGFWAGEEKDANYVCIKAEDEDRTKGDELKQAAWSITNKGGFYWAGGLAVGNYLVFGSDDGASSSGGTSVLRCVNKYTGQVASTLNLSGLGDQRSAICYAPETGKVYFTTKDGHICSASFNSSSGSLGGLGSRHVWDGALSTSTPVYYEGRLYFGVGQGFDGGSNCRFVVADASNLQTIASVQVQGDLKASPLLSTATEDSGFLCFYFTYNKKPGGISLAKVKTDCSSDEDIELVELFDPTNAREYNITSVIATSNGTMFMKNDTGTLFAVGFTDAGRTAAAQRHVTAFEQAVEALFPVTLNSGDQLAAVQAWAQSLSAEVRNLVPQRVFDRLNEAQANYDALASDYQVAQEFTQAVEDLFPVTMEKGDAIAIVRSRANALTDAQLAYVSNATMGYLTRAETEYQALSIDDEQVKEAAFAVAYLFPVSLESGAAIQDVQKRLDALDVMQMAKMPEKVMSSFKEAKSQYQRLANDKTVAEAFEAQVAALGEITLNSGDAIAAAEEAFDCLTEQQRSLVSEDTLIALARARATYDQLVVDKRVVNEFIAKVAALAPITLESGPAITAAEDALAALTESQLAQVPAATLTVLSDARSTFTRLQKGKEAADKVVAMINGLGVITLESGDDIAAAEAALAALTPEEYAMVPPSFLVKLQRARQIYDELKAAEEKKKPDANGETKGLGDTLAVDKGKASSDDEDVDDMIYTASLSNAPKNGFAGEDESAFPWIWALVGGAALLIFAGAGRMRLSQSEDENEEEETY